jgi:hypothetical protein
MVTTAAIISAANSFGMEDSPTADNFKRNVQQRMSTQNETPEQAIKYVLTNLYQDGRAQVVQSMQHDQSEIGQAFREFMASHDIINRFYKSYQEFKQTGLSVAQSLQKALATIPTDEQIVIKNNESAVKKLFSEDINSTVSLANFFKMLKPMNFNKLNHNARASIFGYKEYREKGQAQLAMLNKRNNELSKNAGAMMKEMVIDPQTIKKYLVDHNIMSQEYADTVNIPNYLSSQMQQLKHSNLSTDTHRLKQYELCEWLSNNTEYYTAAQNLKKAIAFSMIINNIDTANHSKYLLDIQNDPHFMRSFTLDKLKSFLNVDSVSQKIKLFDEQITKMTPKFPHYKQLTGYDQFWCFKVGFLNQGNISERLMMNKFEVGQFDSKNKADVLKQQYDRSFTVFKNIKQLFNELSIQTNFIDELNAFKEQQLKNIKDYPDLQKIYQEEYAKLLEILK